MKKIKDFLWKPDMNVGELVENFGNLGYQAIELHAAKESVLKMKRSGAKVFLTFTSNMVTSGLRGFFAQLIKLGLVDVIVTTSGSIEEDIMKSFGEEFEIADFNADDIQLHENGENRVGNLLIKTESFMKFEDKMSEFLSEIYKKKNAAANRNVLSVVM